MKAFSRQRRIFLLFLTFSCCFLFLGWRLFQIQVLQSPDLTRSAVQQRAPGITIFDRRGDIQDRHGRSLLNGRRSLGLIAFPSQYYYLEDDILEQLAGIEGIDRLARPPHGALPFWLSSSLNYQSVAAAREKNFPGVLLAYNHQRYGEGMLAAHVIGYLRESEGLGVSGIERAFDEQLSRGQQTVLAALVDGQKRLIGGLGYRLRRETERPYNVILTIDSELQREVEQLMDRRIKQGAVVVLDPRNGDILAMASRPAFFPGSLSEYLQLGESALINRALWSYQPGSLFKMVVAAAALEEGVAGLFDRFNCTGSVEAGGIVVGCSRLHQKDELTLVEAFAYSCNSVFINLALELGAGKISDYARKMGLGERTGLPIGEKSGNLPSPAEMAPPGNMANTAIGQGQLLVTPLQAARMTAIIAAGGRNLRPRLALALSDSSGRRVLNYLSHRGEQLLSGSTVNKLKYLMQAVMEQGTGRPGAVEGAATGAKTGTAESGRREDGRELLNHWIAGFYPLDRPEAVIVVFADELLEGRVSHLFGDLVRYLESR